MSSVAETLQSTPNLLSNQHSNLTSSSWRLIDQNIEESTPIPVEESNKIVTEEDGSNKDSTTKSRTLPTNTEVVGIRKIQNEKAHIRSEVENPNTGVRVSEYLICTIVQGAIKFPRVPPRNRSIVGAYRGLY